MLLRINAAAAIDGVGTHVARASMLLRLESPLAESEHARLPSNTIHARLRIQALATPAEIDARLASHGAKPDRVIDKPDAILIPALVNAHAHLDLTHIGPRPFDASLGFTGFIRLVLANRLDQRDAIERSIAHGAMLSLRGGVAAVGDIAGVVLGLPSAWASDCLAQTPLHGVSHLEFFGMGNNEVGQIAALRKAFDDRDELDGGDDGGSTNGSGSEVKSLRTQLGLQPHAPYTASPGMYYFAQQWSNKTGHGPWLSTHLAETPEEHELIGHATGPFRGFLERVGWWNDSVAELFGTGRSPIAYFCSRLSQEDAQGTSKSGYVLAHVNDCSDADLQLLAASSHSIAYCPRSSSYFRNHEHFGPHRYREMLAAGINVCLGTDSVINLPDAERISTLDEARFLFARDGLDARTLLAMATVRGARALGLPEDCFAFRSSLHADNRQPDQAVSPAGVVAVACDSEATARNPWEALMRSQAPPEMLALHSDALWSVVS